VKDACILPDSYCDLLCKADELKVMCVLLLDYNVSCFNGDCDNNN
jgi:hypothetical protein